jgi:hypothetical protein
MAFGTDRRDFDLDARGLPTRPDLVSPERTPLTVESAVTELGSDRPAEALTGGARRAGSVADPAPGRLGLGCPAMRTAPHRHGRMVAANDRPVEPAWLGRYLTIEMTV